MVSKLDKKILNSLNENARKSFRQVAKEFFIYRQSQTCFLKAREAHHLIEEKALPHSKLLIESLLG